jgi:hypothetical protein
MTVSSTPSWKSALRAFWLALLLVCCAGLARAQGEVEVKSAALALGEEGYMLNADFTLELSPHLEEVVSRGVPLYFILEFELTRSRWYWFDEALAERSQTYRLSYHALTRQYRLSTGALAQSFATLQEALRILSRVREWQVAEKGALKSGVTYEAAVRLQLDLSQLPKPLQVTAIGRKEWNIGSDWYRWPWTVPERETR